MATNYKQIGYGAKGDDVKTLQQKLNSSGYNLAVDGQFGPKTQAAVKDYQKKNNLAVDGIVGKNTWGTLNKNNTATTQITDDDAPKSDTTPTNEGYVPSETVQQAQALLQQQMANKPGEYGSQYADQIQGILGQLLNRPKFSYDLNADALYKQYAQQYTQQGKMAMMDTMGQAAAMTGGYGNSYAQSVGQQAYQGYMQQLNNMMPELYGMALDQYNQEGQQLLNQYGVLQSQDEQEYGRHRDQVADYYTELQRLTEDARYVADDEYGKYIDERNYNYQQDRDAVADQQWEDSFEYQKDRDAVSDEQWEKEYAESVRQFDEQMDLTEEQWAWEKAQAERAQKESGGSGGGSSNTGASGYDLDHVATMSSEAIANALANYQAAEDDNGLAVFLDDLVATGRITEAMADEWYKLYKTKKDDEVVDTNVPVKKKSGNASGRGANGDPIVQRGHLLQ